MILLDGNSLTIENVCDVVYNFTAVGVAPDAVVRMQASRNVVEQWVREGKVIYGITTGFGDFSNVIIAPDKLETLQENLILSHSAGVGDPLPPAIVRAMLLLRANALAKGFSGVRTATVDHLLAMLNANILPVIPSQGSVGSSGDLAPLAHLVLGAIGKGEVWDLPATFDNARQQLHEIHWPKRSAASALQAGGITPLRLQAKEGLALINGTQMMSAFGALAVHEAQRLSKIADISGAITVDALKGSDNAFDARLHATRPMPGQQVVAANLRAMMHNSNIRESHRIGDGRVQDAYSLRCMPQVHGASRDAIAYAANVIQIEINSATDNPLIFADDGIHIEGGNFHGQPLALALDFLAIAVAELGSIAERRTDRLMHGAAGLPKFLTSQGGLHSGLMIAQYTAAALVSENKILAHPASVDSIPTSANQEDHNSMGSIAARKALQVVEHVRTILAIELMCACQALGFHHPVTGGDGTEAAHSALRKIVQRLDADRELHADIAAVAQWLQSAALLDAVKASSVKIS